MPSAVEYALVKHWHAQNGAGTGPPVLTQNGAGTGPPAEAVVAQPDIPPAGELLLAGPMATLLLVVAVLATLRRRRPQPR